MSFLSELKRRNVIRMAGLYLVGAWLAVQVAETLLPLFGTPDWVLRALVLLLALGLVPALVFAWLYELTPEGLKRDAEVPADASIATTTGRRMDRLMLGGLLALAALIAAERFLLPSPSPAAASAATAPAAANATQPTDATTRTPATADENSVAVLPFANMSGNPEEEYFSDGMTEELLNVLARIPGMRVAARTSVFAFKDQGGDVREIGRTLGVSHIVEGSVRRDGDQVRITAQLIRVEDGFHVWSETFDRKLDSVFELQDEIAGRVAKQLASTLGDSAPLAQRGSVDPVAYDEYLKGRSLLRTRRSPLTTVGHFRKATELAPDFAPAWASLALAVEVSGFNSTAAQQVALGDRLPQMKAAVERARALAPNDALTLHALGSQARSEGRLLEAEEMYQRAIAADPTYPDVREDFSELLSSVGRMDDALAAARELVAMEPSVAVFLNRITQIGVQLDRADLIEEAETSALAVDPTYVYILTARFRQAYNHGRLALARELVDQAFAKQPEVVAMNWVLFRWSQGDPAISDEFAHSLIMGGYTWESRQFAALKGDADLFFLAWNNPRNADKHYTLFNNLSPPMAASFLADPRAKLLLREAGFEDYWRAKGWPDQCRPLGEDDFECGQPAAGD
jgi:TolB-like protein